MAKLILFWTTVAVFVVGLAGAAFLVALAVQFCRGCGLVERRDWLEDDE